MDDFRQQIREDIKEYQEKYPHIPNISKDEWAFNYWILDKLFFEENELIEEKIIDYHDMGIDAFEIYDDTKEIYLIQNKYYSDNTKITADYVKNDFLLRGITALENGTYNKSEELQQFFTKYKNNSEFTVYLQLFVTNNNKVADAEDYIKKFNSEHPHYIAKIFYLNDIEERYFGAPKTNKKNITVKIESINKGTILNINSDDYKLANVIDARYVFSPVVSLYRIYRDAIEKGYPIFEDNIREYLGNKGINKKIYSTLMDKNERKNFFYYNNGITIICDKMKKQETRTPINNIGVSFEIDNPQIVNGCQTVNSIYEALQNTDPAELEKEYKDTFVMLKILEINRNNQEQNILYQNIVKYNNSQNAINENAFAANKSEFQRLQTEFKKKGFLLLIKQSDKNTFATECKISNLKQLNNDRLNRFGLEMKKISDVYIPLEKLMQIINAFVSGGEIAYRNKNKMLKIDSKEYNTALSFIKNITIDDLLDLYLLYMRAEKAKKESNDRRFPIPYYLIDGFANYECEKRKKEKIRDALSTNSKIEKIVNLYKLTTNAYTKQYFKKYEIDYNKMIKQNIDYDMFDEIRDTYNIL